MQLKSTIKIDRILVIILTVFVIILGFMITNVQGQLTKYEYEQNQIKSLLSGSGAVVGFSCGALPISKAEELLQTDVNIGYDQGPTNIIQSTKPLQNKPFWADSCRYESTESSAKYVELYVSTFLTVDAAVSAFPDFFESFNNNVELSAGSHGQRLVYDGGVWYLLRNNMVVQVSASNGNPSEIKEFSRSVFDMLLSKF